jgi:hypothetical protein
MTTLDDHYADRRGEPPSGDQYQPGALTLAQLNDTDDEPQDHPAAGG